MSSCKHYSRLCVMSSKKHLSSITKGTFYVANDLHCIQSIVVELFLIGHPLEHLDLVKIIHEYTKGESWHHKTACRVLSSFFCLLLLSLFLLN